MKILLSLLLLLLILSCNRTKTNVQTQEENGMAVDSMSDKSSHAASKSKPMNMTFMSYEEGDYPHVIFKDETTGKEYDFRYLDENNYSGFQILMEDPNASFGFKANPKYVNKSFIIEAEFKSVPDTDLNGEAIKAEGWVIKSMKEIN